MGIFTTAGKNTILNSGLPSTLYAALHSGAPGADGSANELTGGSPAYARKAVTMGTSSSGSRSATGAVAFDVPAGTTVSYGSLWTAGTGGVCVFTDDLPNAEAFAAQGTYTLQAITLSITD